MVGLQYKIKKQAPICLVAGNFLGPHFIFVFYLLFVCEALGSSQMRGGGVGGNRLEANVTLGWEEWLNTPESSPEADLQNGRKPSSEARDNGHMALVRCSGRQALVCIHTFGRIPISCA
jgi:hypothetical protein